MSVKFQTWMAPSIRLSDLVKTVWEKHVKGLNLIQRWKNKLCAMFRYLGRWARHMTSLIRKGKAPPFNHYWWFEGPRAEVMLLTSQDIEPKCQSNAQLASLLCEEELKWYQRPKGRFLLEGDLNTRYFNSIANDRHGKKRIHSLV
jgi:hypothetical protein